MLVFRAGFEPASSDLKGRYPWPLDDRNEVVRSGAPGRVRICDAQLFKLPLYRLSYGGESGVRGRSRTGVEGFAVQCIASLPPERIGGPGWTRTSDYLDQNQAPLPLGDGATNWCSEQDSNLRFSG